MSDSQKPERKREEIEHWLAMRQLARTDLFWLAHDVLGYDWVLHRVHDPIIDILPHRRGGYDEFNYETNTLVYHPACAIEELDADEVRQILILYPRGSLKTTIATVSDVVQWIINYQDIRIALVTAIGQQAEAVFDEVRKIFQFNERFRSLFPEFCPPARKAADWGNTEAFTIMCRSRFRKEPTLSLITVGKVIAGFHFDVLQ